MTQTEMTRQAVGRACECGARTLELAAERLRQAEMDLAAAVAVGVAPRFTLARVAAVAQAVAGDLAELDRKLTEARVLLEVGPGPAAQAGARAAGATETAA